jgi:hypothetical protein
MFRFTMKPSSGSHRQYLAKITHSVQCEYMEVAQTCYGRIVYRVSQDECARLREGVPYVKVHRYNPKHLYPKLNRYRDNGQRKVWSSGGSTHCNCQLTALSMLRHWVWCHMTADQLTLAINCICTFVRLGIHVSCIVLGTLRTTMTWVRVFL